VVIVCAFISTETVKYFVSSVVYIFYKVIISYVLSGCEVQMDTCMLVFFILNKCLNLKTLPDCFFDMCLFVLSSRFPCLQPLPGATNQANQCC